VPATAAPCWPSSRPTPPSPRPTGSGPRRRWASHDRDHLANLPSCGGGFEEPDDPGRKRVYCSRACQQAAYRARQRTSAGQRHSAGQQRTGREDQRRQRPRSERPGAGQRHHRRQDLHTGQREQRRPPPGSANGHQPGATGSDDLARIRRIIAALLRKAAATSFPHEATACCAKAEALRDKYGL
jgi:hypothetical protein